MSVTAHQTNPQDPPSLTQHLKSNQSKLIADVLGAQLEHTLTKLEAHMGPFTQIKHYQRLVDKPAEQMQRLYRPLSQKMHQRVFREESECQRALNRLETTWKQAEVAYYHRYYFLKVLSSTHLSHMLTLLGNQEKLIRKRSHIYFSILRVIEAREACLAHIKRQLKALAVQDVHQHINTLRERQFHKSKLQEQVDYQVYGYKAQLKVDRKELKLDKTKMQQLGEDINNYRKLTAHVIELITQWKLYIMSLTHDAKKRRQRVEFHLQQKNYLLVILNDNKFVSTSFLCNFYSFATNNDPFILKPILVLEQKNSSQGQLSLQDSALKAILDLKHEDVNNIMSSLRIFHDELEFVMKQANYQHRKPFTKFESITATPGKKYSKSQPKTTQELPKLGRESSLVSVKLPREESLVSQTSIIPRKVSEVDSLKQTNQGMNSHKALLRKTSLRRGLTRRDSLINTASSIKFRASKYLDYEQLGLIKQQVYEKVKQQLAEQQKRKIIQNPAFIALVDEQVGNQLNRMMVDEERQIRRQALQITPLSLHPQEVSSFLSRLWQVIPVKLQAMQATRESIQRLILQIQYCYILRVHTAHEDVAHVIATIDRNVAQYRAISIDFISFKVPILLERVMNKIVEYYWKYETAREVKFIFRHSYDHIQQFLDDLKKKVEANCTVSDRKKGQSALRYFNFFRKGAIPGQVYNPHPERFHIRLYGALSVDKLKHQSWVSEKDNHRKAELTSYDYFLMEIIKKYTNSDDFTTLRDLFVSKTRLKFLLTHIMDIQNKVDSEVEISRAQVQNARQMSALLQLNNQPLLEVTDLLATTNIRLLQFDETLIPRYQLKALSDWQGLKQHRYCIHEQLPYFINKDGAQFWQLPTHQSHHLNILLFDARPFLQTEEKDLSMYLIDCLQRSKKRWGSKYVQNMWIEMMSSSSQNQSQRRYINTFRADDFACVGKSLYIGQSFEWYTDIRIQNGLTFKKTPNDVFLNRPLGVGVVTSGGWVVGCKVMGQ